MTRSGGVLTVSEDMLGVASGADVAAAAGVLTVSAGALAVAAGAVAAG
jgi:hypothetical protein